MKKHNEYNGNTNKMTNATKYRYLVYNLVFKLLSLYEQIKAT